MNRRYSSKRLWNERKNRNWVIPLLIWLSVPISFAYSALKGDFDYYALAMMCVSLIFFVTGTAFCMGHARIIAGFNTMSPKELKEYDLDRISVFSGICWLVMSLILFHVSVSLRIFGENTHGIGLSFIATIAVLLFWTVCITGSGKIPQ